MSWYWVGTPEGTAAYKVFAMTLEDLALNVPEGYTVRPSASQEADD